MNFIMIINLMLDQAIAFGPHASLSCKQQFSLLCGISVQSLLAYAFDSQRHTGMGFMQNCKTYCFSLIQPTTLTESNEQLSCSDTWCKKFQGSDTSMTFLVAVPKDKIVLWHFSFAYLAGVASARIPRSMASQQPSCACTICFSSSIYQRKLATMARSCFDTSSLIVQQLLQRI